MSAEEPDYTMDGSEGTEFLSGRKDARDERRRTACPRECRERDMRSAEEERGAEEDSRVWTGEPVSARTTPRLVYTTTNHEKKTKKTRDGGTLAGVECRGRATATECNGEAPETLVDTGLVRSFIAP